MKQVPHWGSQIITRHHTKFRCRDNTVPGMYAPLPEVHELYTFQHRTLRRTLGGHTVLENSAFWGATHPLR